MSAIVGTGRRAGNMCSDSVDELIKESAERLFRRYGARYDCTGSTPVLTADGKAWRDFQSAGLPFAMLAESDGGVGIENAFEVVRLAGAAALPYPVCESMAANWLLAASGQEPTAQLLTLCGSTLSNQAVGAPACIVTEARNVPWGRFCDLVITIQATDGVYVARVARQDCQTAARDSIAHEPRDRVVLDVRSDRVQLSRLPSEFPGRTARLLGAALRVAQIAGATRATLDITCAYAQQRRQFGRPIGGFQAVQQLLAQMAGHVAAASVAADLAMRGIRDGVRESRIAAAKIRAGEAAGAVAAIAHQVHGAIGFTREYPLHTLTHRLWSWRDEFGSESEWGSLLGKAVLGSVGVPLWDQVTAI
jgi:acyl-CoA dehydrogenase